MVGSDRWLGLLGAVLLLGCGAAEAATASPSSTSAAARDLELDPEALRGLRFAVSTEDLARAMSRPGLEGRFGPIGVELGEADDCHTQGIAVHDDAVLTSCVDRNREVGWLQIYASPIEDLARGSVEGRAVELYQAEYAHPAIGQGLVHVDPGPRLVAPIAHESLGGSHRPRSARIDLRDERGTILCTIDHATTEGVAAAAMLPDDDGVFVVSVSERTIFVDRVDGVRTDGRACRSELVLEAPASELVSAGEFSSYQALASFENDRGERFLLGSVDHRLDTWKIEAIGTRAMKLHPVASLLWKPAGVGRRGVFHEGMAIEALGPSTMRIWAIPHDYERGRCGRGARPNRWCTKALYYVDQRLRPSPPGPAVVERPANETRTDSLARAR